MFYNNFGLPLIQLASQGDAESAHIAAVNTMRTMQRSPWLLRRIASVYQPSNQEPVEICGMQFAHRTGLAAGFDKQGLALPFLEALGFASVEVGSVLPRPQQGSPKPRIFRLKEDFSIINRMGFNSVGAKAVAANLERTVPRVKFPVGMSLGANKDTPKNPDSVLLDYFETLKHVQQYANYVVLNVSSPNTQGLRDLQAAERITQITRPLVDHLGNLPLFVKFTCDMSEEELRSAVVACLDSGVSGFIMSNTTNDRPGSLRSHHKSEIGGLSGPHLFKRALAGVRLIRSVHDKIPIFGVGGVGDKRAAESMFEGGANFVQVYTAFINQGPSIVKSLYGE